MKNNRRQKYIVNSKLQNHLTLQLGIFLLLCTGIAMIDLYLMRELSLARAMSYGDPVRESLSVFGIPAGYFIALGILNISIFFLLSMYYSHRIAGPITNISHAIKRISNGDMSSQVTLRQTDYLKELSVDLNNLTSTLSRSIHDCQKQISSLETMECIQQNAEAIEKLNELEQIISKFVTNKTPDNPD
jgi:methyl-accepting chemotaxis protein